MVSPSKVRSARISPPHLRSGAQERTYGACGFNPFARRVRHQRRVHGYSMHRRHERVIELELNDSERKGLHALEEVLKRTHEDLLRKKAAAS